MGCRRPTWREFIRRDWKDSITISEYWEQVAIYSDLAIGVAKSSLTKLCGLLDRLSDLPLPSRDNLLNHIASKEISSLPENKRFPVWRTLCKLVRKHRKFADAQWAMPEEFLAKIEGVANTLEPRTPELRYHHLFDNRDYDLYDREGSYEEKREQLSKIREKAVQSILDEGGVNAIISFAQKSCSPRSSRRRTSKYLRVN